MGWSGFGGTTFPGATWRPYSASSPFNQPIPADVAVHPRSSQMVSRILQWGRPGNMIVGVSDTPNDWAHPVYFSKPTDPLYTLHATEPWGRNPMEGMQIPIPAGARAAGGGDGHLTVVTPDGWEYDFWQAQPLPPGGGTLNFSWGDRIRVDGNGLGGGATAAEFGSLAGSIRAQELAAGQINHALFIVLKCTSNTTEFGFGTQAARSADLGSSYVYPASKGGTRCSGESDADVPPMGARFQLAMTSAEIDALAVPTWKKTILRALAQYGGFVGDTGGPGFGVQYESGSSYTSFGLEDPFVTFARQAGVPQWNGNYVFNLADNVDWQSRLRIVAPPAA